MRGRRRIYAIDPGRVCGFSVGWGDETEYVGQAEYHDFLLQFNDGLRGTDLVAVERMDPRRWDNDTKLTVEVVGAIKFLATERGADLVEVNASDKKKTMRDVDDRVVAGFGASSHARDAEAIRLWALRYGKW